MRKHIKCSATREHDVSSLRACPLCHTFIDECKGR